MIYYDANIDYYDYADDGDDEEDEDDDDDDEEDGKDGDEDEEDGEDGDPEMKGRKRKGRVRDYPHLEASLQRQQQNGVIFCTDNKNKNSNRNDNKNCASLQLKWFYFVQ